MASPPFSVNQTVPGDAAIVSQFPAQNRSNMDNVNDWLAFEHDASGHHKIPVLTEAERDLISDWVLGSLVFNTDELELQVADDSVPPVWFPAVPAAASIYSEGSWTPALNFGGVTTGITYSQQVGRYTRVGNQVMLWGRIQLSSNGSASGNAQISGLPFTPVTVTGLIYAGSAVVSGGITGLGEFDTNISVSIFTGDTFIGLGAYAINFDSGFPLSEANIDDTADFSFTLSYLTS